MRPTPAPRSDVYLESELVSRFHLSGRQARRIARQVGVRLGRVTLVLHDRLLEYLSAHSGESAEKASKEEHHGS